MNVQNIIICFKQSKYRLSTREMWGPILHSVHLNPSNLQGNVVCKLKLYYELISKNETKHTKQCLINMNSQINRFFNSWILSQILKFLTRNLHACVQNSCLGKS